MTETNALYARMRDAILFLSAQGGGEDRATLAQAAACVGLSPFHFERQFKIWAGVSPIRLQRYFAYRAARRDLSEGASVLDAALGSGFSGPGRLHDAAVAFEALTPGQIRKAGEGLDLRWGVQDSPFGAAVLVASPRGICGLAFAEPGAEQAVFEDLAARWPKARFARDDAGLAALAQGAFAHPRDTPLHVMGTPWQIKVWEALLAIPPGATSTYGAIARAVCTQKASRAVGNAVGANPVGWLIPCHRVLRGSGALGGYRWGVARKEVMLAYEGAQAMSSTSAME